MNTILIVDDELNFVRSLSDGLRRHDMEIVTAGNGREAVEILDSVSVDVVVTDLRMPEMDGFELIAHLRRRLPELPIIVMTAFGTPEVYDKVKGLGSLFYIEKPLDLDRLVKTISRAHSSRLQGRLSGIALDAFLQLVELEQKTCTLEVKSGTGHGTLYCSGGELIDARTEELEGLPAAYEMLSWGDVSIAISNVCASEKRTIEAPIQFVCMEASRLKDEAARPLKSVDSTGPGEHPPLISRRAMRFSWPPDDSTPKAVGQPKSPAAELREAQAEQSPGADNSLPSQLLGDDPVTGSPLRVVAPKPHPDLGKLEQTQDRLKRKIDGFLFSAVVETAQGIPLAWAQEKSDLDIPAAAEHLAATFRSALKLFAKSGWGTLEAFLIPGREYTVVMCALKGGTFFQAVGLSSETPLGMVRAIISRLKPSIEAGCP